MPNPYRFVALGMIAALGGAAASHLVVANRPVQTAAPPALLPVAHANPAFVDRADTLQRGETLTQLLQRVQLAEDEARVLLDEIAKHQNPRRLQAGAVVSYRTGYTDGELRNLEFRLDADRKLNVQRAEGAWVAEVAEVPVFTDTVVLSGAVRSSLYAALVQGDGAGVPAEERRGIADVLADRIFAWQVDFSRDLRPGDEYRILYERRVRPDGTARSSRVLGVQFSIAGRERQAYLFRTADGREDYFDQDGESLRRAFLRAPLEFRRISSAFSTGRFHPVLKVTRPHNGIDYAAAAGTPVRAVGDGVIGRAGWGGGYGNLVEIRHQRGYTSRYAHLQRFANGIRGGARVRQGDIIGYVGATGLATGPHLHYEFHENGRPVNPNSIRYITGEPVSRGQREAFRSVVRTQVAAMQRLETGTARLASSGAAPVQAAD
jgi:murein DD-endopeptidase MepM/ murein hydrolase activator NlpD